MNEVQEFLLKLVKEIDDICIKHDIDYYIFAGSMLGVERNEGFLPWDDDMDIVMTKANYEKFKEVVKTELPLNRVFEDKENCPDYPLHFGKYTSSDTASIIRSLAFGDCTAGFWIDVMYVAPMPVEEKHRRKIKRLFPVLCELENEFYTEFPYRYKGFYWRYKLCLALSKIFGKKKVIQYLRNYCDNFPEEECYDYFLYHSLDADFRIYSKECFEKPVRAKYADEIVNKSPANRKMCREAYGDGWMMVPNSANQAVHSTITDCKNSYTRYKQDFMQFIDHDEVMRDFNEIKEAHMEKVHRERVSLDYFYKLEAQVISMETINRIENYNTSMEELIEQKRYKEIGRLFTKYISLQWSARIKNNNIFVPMNEEYLYGLLLYLICERQEFYSAAKLVSIYRNVNNSEPEYFKEIDQLIEISKTLSIHLWDDENYEKVVSLYQQNEHLVKKYGLKDFEQAYCIALLKTNPEKADEIETRCISLIKDRDLTGIALKVLGDLYLKKGKTRIAADFYHCAKRRLRNGLLLLELGKSLKRICNE